MQQHGLILNNYAEQKEADPNECKLYDSTFVKFWNRNESSIGERKQSSGCLFLAA